MDLIRTIQSGENPEFVRRFFEDESWRGEHDCFPLRGVPRDAEPGDWLYVNFRGLIVGRCRIRDITLRNEIAEVGDTQPVTIEARCWLLLDLPGEPAPGPIYRRGRQGIRYDRDRSLAREWERLGL